MGQRCYEHELVASQWYERKTRHGKLGYEDAIQLVRLELFFQFAKSSNGELKADVGIFRGKIFEDTRKPVVGDTLDRTDADQTAVQIDEGSGSALNLIFRVADCPQGLQNPGHIRLKLHSVFRTDKNLQT